MHWRNSTCFVDGGVSLDKYQEANNVVFLKNDGSFSHFDFSFNEGIVMNLTILFEFPSSSSNEFLESDSEIETAFRLLARCELSHSPKEVKHVL